MERREEGKKGGREEGMRGGVERLWTVRNNC
jgi:hypothetical protein